MTPIIIINPTVDILFLICLANALLYLVLYPRFKKRTLEEATKWDIIFSATTLILISINYYGSEYTFNFFGIELGWFWFSFWVYTILDGVLSIFYLPTLKKGKL